MNLVLDKNHYRYRICRYCNKEFMAHNLSMVFCGHYCADTFYNHFKRGKKDVLQYGNEFINEEELVWGEEEDGLGLDSEDPITIKNLEILSALNYDKNNEVFMPVHLMEKLGFDFDYYETKIALRDEKERFFGYLYLFGDFSWICMNSEIVNLSKNN